jgi:hypothetical protein
MNGVGFKLTWTDPDDLDVRLEVTGHTEGGIGVRSYEILRRDELGNLIEGSAAAKEVSQGHLSLGYEEAIALMAMLEHAMAVAGRK